MIQPSATCGKSKIGLITRLKQNKAKTVQGHAAIAELIMDHNARVEKVEEVWNRLLVIMLGRKQSDPLNTMRYVRMLNIVMKMVASAKCIDPQKLPLTANAACYVLQFVSASARYSLEGIYYYTILFIKGRKPDNLQINHIQHQRTILNLFDASACFLLQIHVTHVAIHTPAVGMDA